MMVSTAGVVVDVVQFADWRSLLAGCFVVSVATEKEPLISGSGSSRINRKAGSKVWVS